MIRVNDFEKTTFIPCDSQTTFIFDIKGEDKHVWEIREALYARLMGWDE